MANITLHLNCVYDWDRAKAFLAQDGIRSAFLLNANADQIQYALDHVEGIVTVRVFDPWNEFQGGANRDFEKDILFRHKVAEFVQWINTHYDYARFKGNKRVRWILGWNEMYYNGAEYQRNQNDAMILVAKALIAEGYGVALFGLAADKTLQMTDMNLGVWDALIDFADEYQEWVHVDAHEYEVGRIASQHLKTIIKPYPDSMIDPLSMHESNWGEIAYSGDGIYSNWHIGRVAWLLARAEKRGKKLYWGRGECGWDYKDDGSLKTFIPNVFTPKYGRPSGANSLRPLFSHLLGVNSLSDEELDNALFKDLEYLAENDPETCLFNAVFCWHNHPEHKAFNLAEDNHIRLRYLMGKQNGSPLPLPPDVKIPSLDMSKVYTVASLADWVLLRSEPKSTSSILGRINEVSQEVRRAPLSSYENGVYPQSSGHPWEYIFFPQKGLYAWIARDLVKFTEVNTQPLPEAEIARLKAELATAQAKLSAIRNIANS